MWGIPPPLVQIGSLSTLVQIGLSDHGYVSTGKENEKVRHCNVQIVFLLFLFSVCLEFFMFVSEWLRCFLDTTTFFSCKFLSKAT